MITSRRRKRPRLTTPTGVVWRWCAVASVIVALEVIAAVAVHRDAGGLAPDVGAVDYERAVWALFVATNRDQPELLDVDRIDELLSSPNPLLREWIFTSNFSRILPPRRQREALEALVDPGSFARGRFFLEHGIHQTPWITLAEFDAYLETIDD